MSTASVNPAMFFRFGLEKAASVTLVGTGSGAKGVGYNCDHVARQKHNKPVLDMEN
jgi:hypothetical protein